MYVGMYVSRYLFCCVYIYVYTYACMHVCMHACTYVRTYVCMYYMPLSIYIYIHVYLHVYVDPLRSGLITESPSMLSLWHTRSAACYRNMRSGCRQTSFTTVARMMALTAVLWHTTSSCRQPVRHVAALTCASKAAGRLRSLKNWRIWACSWSAQWLRCGNLREVWPDIYSSAWGDVVSSASVEKA